MRYQAIPPWSSVATDPSTKLIKFWRDGKRPELPPFVHQGRVRLIPRNPVHPAIIEEWHRL